MIDQAGIPGDDPLDGVRSATTLALWTAAWQAGCSADRMLAVLAATGLRAGARAASAAVASLCGLPGPGEPSAPAVELLSLLRRGGPPALVLPVPGDLRGLPVGGDIVVPALDAGAVVVLPEAGVGLVAASGQWRAFGCDAPHRTLAPADALRLVDDAVTEATRALATADVASARGNPREAVRRAILAGAVDTPPGMPAAACALLARATTLGALLSVAGRHETAAVTGRQVALVDDALAPLRSAVREAQRTAVAMTVTALLSPLVAGTASARPAAAGDPRHRS